jgi:hypothetical protein
MTAVDWLLVLCIGQTAALFFLTGLLGAVTDENRRLKDQPRDITPPR